MNSRELYAVKKILTHSKSVYKIYPFDNFTVMSIHYGWSYKNISLKYFRVEEKILRLAVGYRSMPHPPSKYSFRQNHWDTLGDIGDVTCNFNY